jgi:hypothetical protein
LLLPLPLLLPLLLLANVEAAALTRTTFALACLAGSAIAGTTVEERPFRAAPSREETPLGAVVAYAPRLKPSRSVPERRPEGRLFHPGQVFAGFNRALHNV